jgi:putative sigma-54 modulation protein
VPTDKEKKTMQTANVNVPVRVDARHFALTEAIRLHTVHKIDQLHLDYPRIIEAHVILDIQKHGNRHFAEIILHCADHITLESSATTTDIYVSIDSAALKIAQQMRKFKTRHLAAYRSARRAA